MEEFINSMRSLSKRINSLKSNIETEEATKMSLIIPFFQSLGYDVFNPQEFLPEFIADVGIKKGEKVDYAIMENGEPLILIEAKPVKSKLEKHDSQLFRYFGTTKAKFAILTNGEEYKFFTDLEEQNKMDATPFFVVNFSNLKESQIIELAKFRKVNFNIVDILDTASELKYSNEIKSFLSKQFNEPSDEFIGFILSHVYEGRKTQSVIDKFNGIMKKSLKQFINESASDKLQAAIKTTTDTANEEQTEVDSGSEKPEMKPQVVTTPEEIEGYVIIKMLLKDILDGDRLFYRDNLSYFNVLIDDNIRKWVCRLGLDGSKKYIQFNDASRTSLPINKVTDIYEMKDKIIETAKPYI